MIDLKERKRNPIQVQSKLQLFVSKLGFVFFSPISDMVQVVMLYIYIFFIYFGFIEFESTFKFQNRGEFSRWLPRALA